MVLFKSILAFFAVGLTLGSEFPSNETYSQNLLRESMAWMDMFYDADAGYLYDLDSNALVHGTRHSAWYAAGLLARNKHDDVEQALKITRNVISGQFKDPEKQWYGDYQIYPEEPTVGTDHYPAVMYNSWDPNWRGFIGTTFVLMMEEFPDLIPNDDQSLIIESLYNTSVGDSYRVGGVDGDNLYPAYSNPSIMRAFVSGWTGRKIGDANMTLAAETYASEVIELFERDNTLSEFNSGTYAGVSLYALTLWAKYMPEDSVMRQKGASMIKYTWETLSSLYNANIRNVAGPWDRSYGYDMTRYLSILALQIWTIIGKDKSPMNAKPYAMGHKGDFAIGPLVAILAPFHNSLLEKTSVPSTLLQFPGEHNVETTAFSPPFDTYPRNITAYLSANLTLGAETFSEDAIGGPATSANSFNPAVAQWLRPDGTVGWATYHPQVKSLVAIAGQGFLSLTYPDWQGGDKDNVGAFVILIGTNSPTGTRDITGWDGVEGVAVTITGNINMQPTISFNGIYGGAGEVINSFSVFEFWNFTYTVPSGITEAPNMMLQFKVKGE
ncbi:hypothetical protein MKZ38_003127 [Zalerion maritima]|uniref:Uncharacterized protein n=1 Tax=Zalerion maritima TaxID=339359 RepID=A0AAD5WX63_9PEZI|nr:hypothetical protein MKZ38_003127 [Zalerion maritima]